MRTTALARLAASRTRCSGAAIGEVKKQTLSDKLNTEERATHARVSVTFLKICSLFATAFLPLETNSNYLNFVCTTPEAYVFSSEGEFTYFRLKPVFYSV